jgi:bifunctional non-homologous end joining protein LigD
LVVKHAELPSEFFREHEADTRPQQFCEFLIACEVFKSNSKVAYFGLVGQRAQDPVSVAAEWCARTARYSDHQSDHGPAFHRLACEHGVEGIVSKRANGRYEPDRRTWLKIKCLNREEFVVVGWSDPEGSRHRIGALLLGYYTPDDKLIYAGRAGTGMPEAQLERLWQRLRPLAVEKTSLTEPPPRGTRFGSPLVQSRVHWVRPEMVVEVSYVEWTPDLLLRHVVYLGAREDKLAIDVRRSRPHAVES